MQEEFGFKACIEKNFGALKSGVKMSTISDFLIERGVLKLAEWRNLKSMEIDEDERTEKFLFDLCEKTVNEFQIFIKALRNNGHEQMASKLEATYSQLSKKCAQEEGNPSKRLELSPDIKSIQAQVPIEKSNKGEEAKLVAMLQSMRHDQEKMLEKMSEEQKKMTEEQRRMSDVIDTMGRNLQNIELEIGKLRADVQRKGEEHAQLTEENERLESEIKEQRNQIDKAYLELERVLKSQECDQIKHGEVAQKYKELLKAKENIDSDHNKIVEKVSLFEIKFSEIMGKKISFENSLVQLEIHLRKEQRNKTSLLKELEEKTQASQNVVQLKMEVENLRKQELDMRRNKEEMEMKIKDLTKAKNALKFQYDILHVKYNREKDKVLFPSKKM